MTELDDLPAGVHRTLGLAIRELVPAAWRVVGVERDLDELERVTVQLKLSDVRRVPEAPRSGTYWAGWTVTIATPHVDPETADPGVFDALLELVAALDGIPWLKWSTAEKVLVSGRYGFDITVDTLTTRDGDPAVEPTPAAYAADETTTEGEAG